MQIKHIAAILGMLVLPVLPAAAQPKAKFSSSQRDLGLLSWRCPGVAVFDVTNTGNKPLLITDVQPDCGCTAVKWTTDPIRPGATGSVSVTYDSELLGRFDKGVCIITNTADSLTYVRLTGSVINREIIDTAKYRYRIGNMRLNTEQIEFDNVNRGDQPQQTISVANVGKTTIEPELMHLPAYLTATAQPQRLRPGQKGKMVLTLNSNDVRDMGLTQTSVYLSRRKGDRVGTDNEISVSVIMVPYFNNLSQAQLSKAPCLKIDRSVLSLPKLEPKKKYKETVLLSNVGHHTLDIRSLQVLHPCINVDLSKQTLEPGQSVKLKITVLADYLKQSKSRLRILLTTNDPQHPKAFIDINTAQ